WRPSLPTRSLSEAATRMSVALLALVTLLLVGFPMYTGQVVPDIRPKLPPAHVQVPVYWHQMAEFVNQMPASGSLLVMPPDDFYAMPYLWGYYGGDTFVADSFRRPVLLPNPQGGYVQTTS